jgi:hypothetical protein
LKNGVVLSLSEGGRVRRRDFIKVVAGSIAAWPLAARAQQHATQVIGFLIGSTTPKGNLAAFHQGLSEEGYVEGGNVAIEYRSAAGQYGRLPALAADLVRHKVAVIAAVGTSAPGLAAKSAMSKGAWDYYKVLSTIAANDAVQPLEQSKCALIKK